MERRSKSVGAEIVERLRALNRTVKSGGKISERFTCNRVILDLAPRKYDPAMVKKVRKTLGASQAIFAQFLGVSASTVRAWEQGQNPVPPLACRFMDEINRNPAYWRDRIAESIVDKQMARS